MRVLKSSPALNTSLKVHRRKGHTIGFVPTMGYLHEGHLSLVRQAKKKNKIVVVSIFVNPLQFGPGEDLGRYPRNLKRDLKMLEAEKVDFVFVPLDRKFYSPDFQTTVSVARLSRPLCGRTRPAHFAGVCTVVLKLLNSVQPDVMYLGQKDYQQYRVVLQMAKDLELPVRICMAPIVREPDGLAMSSRNIFLSWEERCQAAFLYRALRECKRLVKNGVRDIFRLKKTMRGVLRKASKARVDTLEIVDADTLESMVRLKQGGRALAALAVFFGKTRLIDNILIEVK